MIRVLHLVDDTTLGGVTRTLALLGRRLGREVRHEQAYVGAGPGLPRVDGIDAVFLHVSASWSRLPLLARLAARRGPPVAIVEHTYTAAFERLAVPSPTRFRAMLRLAYGLTDRVVAVSEGQATWMRAAGLARPGRIVVVRPASDCEHLLALAPPAPRPGPLRLGAMGRLSREKGFDVLVEAMRRLPPGLARLEIAGAGPDEPALRRAAAGVAGVELVGQVSEHMRWLGGIDAMVVPSRRESYGLVALEARVAARPVVATGVDGLPEQLAAGGGIVVPPGDPAALAAAIERLATLDLAGLGLAARRSADGHLARTVAGWRQLVADLAGPGATTDLRRPGPVAARPS